MDKIARLTPFLSVTDQLAPEDVVRAAALGFRAIVNNRPDGEAQEQPDQHASDDVAHRAPGRPQPAIFTSRSTQRLE